MEDNDDTVKIDEVMLQGFQIHPTDEELVGFIWGRLAGTTSYGAV